jgi:hypothetical protein
MILNYLQILFKNTSSWIQHDWQSNPIRCVLEIMAWCLSIFCSTVMMLTVPNPPFLMLYPLFITQCAIFAWASWTRRSIGMFSNYILLVTIDFVALTRLLLQQL